MSINPVSELHPSRSAGFLLRNPFKTEAAFTDSDLGILIVFSRITEKETLAMLTYACKEFGTS